MGRPDAFKIMTYRIHGSKKLIALFTPIYHYGVCVNHDDCLFLYSKIRQFFKENLGQEISLPADIANAQNNSGHYKRIRMPIKYYNPIR